MGPYLLDANVLIALAWPEHVSHATAQRWFARSADQGWATCPLTQIAFVRVLSNPQFSVRALAPQAALDLLKANIKHPGHAFWADSIRLDDAVRGLPRVAGHRQIADAYLVGLASRREGRLATLDHRLSGWLGPAGSEIVTLIA